MRQIRRTLHQLARHRAEQCPTFRWRRALPWAFKGCLRRGDGALDVTHIWGPSIGRTLVAQGAIATVERALEAVGGAAFYRDTGLERAFRAPKSG